MTGGGSRKSLRTIDEAMIFHSLVAPLVESHDHPPISSYEAWFETAAQCTGLRLERMRVPKDMIPLLVSRIGNYRRHSKNGGKIDKS